MLRRTLLQQAATCAALLAAPKTPARVELIHGIHPDSLEFSGIVAIARPLALWNKLVSSGEEYTVVFSGGKQPWALGGIDDAEFTYLHKSLIDRLRLTNGNDYGANFSYVNTSDLPEFLKRFEPYKAPPAFHCHPWLRSV